MKHYHLIEQLQQEIKNRHEDIRAESQLALAMENGLASDDFVICCDSFFHREYSKDVLSSDLKEDVSKKNYLQLHLTRCGLYEHLPEGLFYTQGKSLHQSVGAAEMAAEYKINKRKEQEARRFFVPLENDFFQQRIQLEQEEMQQLEGFETGLLNNYFTDFWNISSTIPASIISSFIKLLPHAHRISGNTGVMALCLRAILREAVNVRVIPGVVSKANANCLSRLGCFQLGVDMVLGEQFCDDYTVMEFSIGPLQNSPIADYLEGGHKKEFLNMFNRFFVPIDIDVITKIEVTKEKSLMVLHADNEPVLGYSTLI